MKWVGAEHFIMFFLETLFITHENKSQTTCQLQKSHL